MQMDCQMKQMQKNVYQIKIFPDHFTIDSYRLIIPRIMINWQKMKRHSSAAWVIPTFNKGTHDTKNMLYAITGRY